ncbi:methyl-accepting chemotaxis protein [Spirochaeta africana]|uniref:Methyl-accepting chemotaxis protein n=1 Tax=Spirochaeta africana (strain ATCC 700263 / DSM 8902 / Z-7692) TaxID=889378 RepID=H9UL37_SPIAZ|nr:methyl-accepting chemotaxis protein [Spirochaeta africana]AFG38230.1 methyl-accepting chemotaxis protein [Spirochaeta africana DSM 8902]
MKSITETLLPAAQLSDLPLEYQKRIPYLVRTNIALMAYFGLSGAARFVTDTRANQAFFMTLLVITGSLLPLSLLLLRRRRYVAGAYITGICVLLNVNLIGFLLPVLHEQEVYRSLSFLLAFLVVNSLVALTARQVMLVGVAGSLGSFAAYIALRQIPAAANGLGDIPTLSVLGIILLAVVGYMTVLQKRFSRNLVGVAEAQRDTARNQLQQLQRVVAESRSDMAIGDRLQEASDAGRAQGTFVALSVQQLEQQTDELTRAVDEVDRLTASLTGNSRTVREAMELQGANVEETSASIIQINATVQNLSSTSTEKQALVDDISRRIGQQEQQLADAVSAMERVQASSADMVQIINSILDISEQTGILAMNASIEAAHAGAEGRGFGVIAGEIRKLALESRANADRITRAIQENNSVVKSTTEQFHRFSRGMSDVGQQFRDVLQVLQHIGAGLTEISTGTQQIQEATQQLVASSHQTDAAIESTLADVSHQDEIATALRGYADTVAEQVRGLDQASKEIELQLAAIHRIGRENAARMGEMTVELDRISTGSADRPAE